MHKTFSRRGVIGLSSVALAVSLPRRAVPQAYPARPVRIIVGYAPGGATDITARLIADRLSVRLRQQFVVENRPGAATNIATEQVVRSAPDGHTLLMASAANAINASLFDNLSFTFARDMAAVAGVNRMQNVLEIHPSLPVHTVPELIAYGRQHPNMLIAGSAGNGSPGHVSIDLFKMMTGISILHVPYRGAAPALADLLAGRTNLMFDNMATAIEHIRSGSVRALAVTTTFRSPLLPNLPTIDEFVPGYESSSWYGLTSPRGTPTDLIKFLNHETNSVLSEPAVASKFVDMGAAVLAGSPADFEKLIITETEKWGRVVRFSNTKPN